VVNSKLFYYRKLVIENIVYIIALLIYVFIFLYLGLIYSHQYWQMEQRINELKKENAILKDKKQIIENYHLSKKNELDQFDNLLMRLIPTREDFFSIIASLETLSQETGFQIVGYRVNFNQPRKESFSIIVSGEGDKDKFIKFLTSYNFSGERLITIDKISFSKKKTYHYQINLTFYSAPAKINSRFGLRLISDQDYQFLKTLKDKLSFVLVTGQTEGEKNNEEIDYPANPNPF